MKGIITAVIRGKGGKGGGYFFIRDELNVQRFSHLRNLVNKRFEELREGMTVVFKPITIPDRGFRAEEVTIDEETT